MRWHQLVDVRDQGCRVEGLGKIEACFGTPGITRSWMINLCGHQDNGGAAVGICTAPQGADGPVALYRRHVSIKEQQVKRARDRFDDAGMRIGDSRNLETAHTFKDLGQYGLDDGIIVGNKDRSFGTGVRRGCGLILHRDPPSIARSGMGP